MHELILLGITIPEIILYLIPLIALSAIGIFLEQEEEGKASLTCCPLCGVDDFIHVQGCKLDRFNK